MKNNTYLENSVKNGSPDLNLTPMKTQGYNCSVYHQTLNEKAHINSELGKIKRFRNIENGKLI